MSRTRINEDDAPDLQTDAEAATHASDTTGVHGIADTSTLSTTAHDHDADYEAIGATATHSADTTAVHGITDTSVLATATDVSGAITTHEGLADPHPGYLTPAEGNAAYEATGAVATHAGLADPHVGYRLESADHSHASTGIQAGTVSHDVLTDVSIDDHHARDHAINGATHTGTLDDAQIPAGITRDAEAAAAYAAIGHTHSGATTTYAPGSFTVATGNYMVMTKRLVLTGSQRATLEGDARLTII